MAKASQAIQAPSRDGKYVTLKVASNTKILEGTLVAINATGFAVSASDAVGLKVVGRAETFADNTGGSDGKLEIKVARGIFRYGNSSTKPIAQKNWSEKVYIEDDNTVAIQTTNSICAGACVGVDDEGVWVDVTKSE